MSNETGTLPCKCPGTSHQAKIIVVTGGPGAGKTAALELARRTFCSHVAVLPEAASILFSGGFWRHESREGKMAAQRAIYHVQKELETMALQEKKASVIICDRGTLDGLAYWPDSEESFFKTLGVTKEDELKRYSIVFHLRTPLLTEGYNNQNPVRTEPADLAAIIDAKILEVWSTHPNRKILNSSIAFVDKAKNLLELINAEIPECCRINKSASRQAGK